MLKLLQSIFGSTKQGSYPESLVREAIERAVDGTDPWLRAELDLLDRSLEKHYVFPEYLALARIPDAQG